MDATREGVTEEQQEQQEPVNEEAPKEAAPETEQEAAPPPDSPAARRLAAMDEIENRRLAELTKELDAESPRQDEPDNAAQVAAQMDDELIDESALRRKVKMVVDGEEIVVPLEQLVRNAQKNGAADKRLAEATELLRQAREQNQARGETVGKVQTSAESDPSQDETVKTKLKDALAAIFSGDEDAATEAFAQVLASRQPAAPQVDTDAVAAAVTQKLDERSALLGFFEAYPKIASNRYLQAATDDAVAYFQQQGKPLAEALDLAGQAVYKEFGYEREQKAARQSQQATTRQDTVAARKAALDIPVGRTVSAEQSRNAPESSESSRSQIIAEMAAARRGEMPGARR